MSRTNDPLHRLGMRRPRLRRLGASVVTAAVIASAAAGCSSASGTGAAAGGGVLTMGFTGAPISLNPVLGGSGPDGVFPALAYDTLTWLAPNGQLYPDLATSWTYLGTKHLEFELTLRPNVKFQDGSTMTAQDVVASMDYFLKAGGSHVVYAGDIASVSAVGPLKVLVTYKQPNPDAAATMDQTQYIGFIIGPKGLANPQSLLTTSDGTGQYNYDAGKSVANNVYYYTRNPTYWNPKAQMYSAIEVRDILQPSAMLSAVETGQIQWALGNASTEAAAKADGLQVVQAPFFNFGLALSMRNGTVAKPLQSQDVREAIGYALNRAQMAAAIGTGYAIPSDQISLPGTAGYTSAAGYTYNLAKAKELMAEGGYPNGFPLTLLTESILDPGTQYTQVLASALSAIGIKATIQSTGTDMDQFVSDAFSQKYAAVVYPAAGTDMWQVAESVLPVSIYNPAGEPEPKLQALLNSAYAASGATQTRLYQEAAVQFEQIAWFIPAFSTEELAYVSAKLANVTASVLDSTTYPTSPIAADAWHPAS
jgi:peptide/nickel transport system substrate-binding protein